MLVVEVCTLYLSRKREKGLCNVFHWTPELVYFYRVGDRNNRALLHILHIQRLQSAPSFYAASMQLINSKVL